MSGSSFGNICLTLSSFYIIGIFFLLGFFFFFFGIYITKIAFYSVRGNFEAITPKQEIMTPVGKEFASSKSVLSLKFPVPLNS